MLTIAAIAALALSGSLPTLDDSTLRDAQYSVLFARDPAHMGDEPHLRHEVDACGLDDDTLVTLDCAIWAELAIREDRATDARMASIGAIGSFDMALPLAA